jgi:hypothetical protein
MSTVILLMLLFQLKHFVFDFLYQPPWMYKNKGTYMHQGGLAHAGIHFLSTFVILLFFVAQPLAAVIAFTEFVLHYHIDWGKMNLNKMLGWSPTTSENFWRLLGFDQLLHQLTYVWIIWMVV